MRVAGRFALNKRADEIDAAISAVVRQARRRVAFYEGLLDKHAEDVGLDHLCELPITTKALLVEQRDRRRVMRDRRFPLHRTICTSGTTGQVLFVYMSQAEALFRKLVLLEVFRLHTSVRWPLHRAGRTDDIVFPRALPSSEWNESRVSCRWASRFVDCGDSLRRS